jgi:beta-lactamase class A
VDLGNPGLPSGSYRGSASYYPASVVKVFYLAYYEAQKDAGNLRDTPELARAVKDMITVSSNDATGLVVDSITGTTSGPELSGRAWETWKGKRNAVNRFFASRGYRDLNASQKTFCEDAYGREQTFRDGGKNRNRMSTDLVACVNRVAELPER